MAAKAVAVPLAAEHIRFWDRFQSLAEQRIREGNLVSGEQLWEIVTSPGVAPRFTIQSTRHAAESLECSLNLETGVLTCRPGTAIKADPLNFHILRGIADTLRRNCENCTLEQAMDLILDELLWIEEWNHCAPDTAGTERS